MKREKPQTTRRLVARVALSTLTVLLYSPPVHALDARSDISQYAHDAWTVRGGFSLGNIYAMAQTDDGYLWFGTEFGLFRSDGVRSMPWQPPAGQQLPDKNINALLVTRDGSLWIGTFGGLVTWSGGKLSSRPEPELAKQFVASLYEDREGTVWAGTLETPSGRVCAIRTGGTQCFGDDGAFGRAAWALYEDTSGTLWAAAQTGLWRLQPGPPKRFPTPVELIGLTMADDGRLLIAMHGAGLMQLAGNRLEPYPIRGAINPDKPLPDRELNANRVLRDRDGGLWIGTVDRGLIHVHHGRTDVFSRSDGLSGDVVLSLMEDREGNVWVATTGGLDRFRELAVTTVSVKQGLSSDATHSVLAATDGSIWIGAHDGLTRLKDGQARIFRKGTGLPDDANHSLFQDHRGRIWVSTRRGLASFEDGRFVRAPAVAAGEVHFISGDNQDHLWLSEHRNLVHLRDDRLVEQIPWSDLGRSQSAEVLLADREAGGLWLGFWVGGGLLFVKDRQVRASYTPAQGLGEGHVTSLEFDRDGALWAATEGGLSRLKDGRITTMTSRNGLPCETIHWSIEDDDRSFWLYTGCGLVRITRTELDAWIADPKRRITTTIWDAADGVRLRSTAASAYGPRVAKGSDGKLWFVTGDGVQVIDPHHVAANKLPPPVRIEAVTSNGRIRWQNIYSAAASDISLPPRVRDLEIDFTALSLVAPEKVRFKYKLDGQDSDWREVVRERHAHYTNLSPGDYRFRVIASNNSGVWNETGDTLEFSVHPAYYQTNWFRAFSVAMALALLWAAYYLRIRQLEKNLKRLHDVIETIPAMAWTARPDGSNEFVNRRWAEYTGLSPDDTAGSGWMAAVHPEDREAYREKWRACLAAAEPFEFEARFRSAANGEYHWLLARGVPVRDEDGNVRRWYGILTDIEDRKRAEDTLRESEARFRTFVDHVGDAILIQDEQGTIVDVNRQGCESIGYTREEVLGKRPSASFCLNAEREDTEMEEATERTAAGETAFDRHWHRRKDGTVFPVEVYSTVFWYRGGRFLLKAVRDISESLRAEDAVRNSEKQLRDVIDTIPAYVWSAQPDGSVDFINQRFLEYSGFSFDQATGDPWQAAIHPGDRDHYLEVQHAAVTSGQPFEVEARLRRADGQYRWLLFRSVPLRDQTGTVVKRYGVSTDIDDRRRAEEALKRSAAYLADAQRLTHTGIWASDPTSTPLYWSEEVFRLFGFDSKYGLPPVDEPLERIHPADLDKFRQAFDRAIHEKLDSEVEFRILLSDGSVKHVHAIGHPVLDSSGEVVEVVGTTVDITERKRAEEARQRLRELEAELAHINRVSMMGELATSIAHEVNQPLAGIVSNGGACLRWLAGDVPNLEEAREAARRIMRDGKRAGEVIARIRALTRRNEAPTQELDLNETIREILVLVGDEAQKNRVMIETRFAHDLPRVSGDRVQLQQVLLNLVMNAIEAVSGVGNRRRELVITTGNTDEEQVAVSVKDSGMGLAPGTADKIFDPFYTTKATGMGMGLSISRSIIRRHGGRLWATANDDGAGTTFHFTLPKCQEQESVAGVAGP